MGQADEWKEPQIAGQCLLRNSFAGAGHGPFPSSSFFPAGSWAVLHFSVAPVVAWRSPTMLQCLRGAPGRFAVSRTSTARAQEMTFGRPLTSSPLRKLLGPRGPSVHKWVRTHGATPRKPCDTLSKAVSVYAVFYPDCIFLWSDCLEEKVCGTMRPGPPYNQPQERSQFFQHVISVRLIMFWPSPAPLTNCINTCRHGQ